MELCQRAAEAGLLSAEEARGLTTDPFKMRFPKQACKPARSLDSLAVMKYLFFGYTANLWWSAT
jgi:hypothetical protein